MTIRSFVRDVTRRAWVAAVTFILAVSPGLVDAKGADGQVLLQGAIAEVNSGSDILSFRFTGRLSFIFYTAPQSDPARREVSVNFEVSKLEIRVPKFDVGQYDREGCRFIVTYKNATENAAEAARLKEGVTVSLTEPKLSYDVNGVLISVDSAVAQVMPESLSREMRDHGMPAVCGKA